MPIQNDAQLGITRSQVAHFRELVEALESLPVPAPGTRDAVLREAEIGAAKSVIDELEEEISAYQARPPAAD